METSKPSDPVKTQYQPKQKHSYYLKEHECKMNRSGLQSHALDSEDLEPFCFEET